jgi:MoxR-like ATPase
VSESLPSLRETLTAIIEQYPEPDQIGTDKEYYEVDSNPELQTLIKTTAADAVKNALEQGLGIKYPYKIAPSLESGSMSDIPFIPILIENETRGTSRGIYVVYLFDPVEKCVHLTLNQAGTEAQRTSGRPGITPSQYDILEHHADHYRLLLPDIDRFDKTQAGLTEELKRARSYNRGTIICKTYELETLATLPETAVIEDLNRCVDAYTALLDELYRTPELDTVENVWSISPDGDEYWSLWNEYGIASLGHGDYDDFDSQDTNSGIQSKPPSAPEKQLYRFQFEITEGDIIVAGAKINKVDVVFGIGRVTDAYPADSYVINRVQEETEIPHERFISVDWQPIGPDGIGINCWKEGSRLFQRWTLHQFKADVGDFLGAIERRMHAADLTAATSIIEDTATKINAEITTPYDLTPIPPEAIPSASPITERKDINAEESNSPDSYTEWRDTKPSVIDSSEAIPPHPDLVFKEENPIARIQSAIRNGKHVILTGPPGTGKTELARHVAKHYVNDDHEMVTATADWTTFDTIGGYRPDAEQELTFHPGVFLDRFMSDEDGTPANKWLIIDELNRANIDKAFGSLFSALTGETITLPFDKDNQAVTLIGDPDRAPSTEIAPSRYYIPEDWRLIATMNTYDKTSLYQMSFAFMRRFAFIPVNSPSNITRALVEQYAASWFGDTDWTLSPTSAAAVAEIWQTINETRTIGPAIIKDIVGHLRTTGEPDLTEPLIMYVLPQLEGLTDTKQRTLVESLQQINNNEADEEYIRIEETAAFVSDFFGVDAVLTDDG